MEYYLDIRIAALTAVHSKVAVACTDKGSDRSMLR